jgi:hypothetical protein
MKKSLTLVLLALCCTPAFAQTKPAKSRAAAVPAPDVCEPIGRTADGKLIYSLKCDNLPAPPPRPVAETAPVEERQAPIQRSGLFGLSFGPAEGTSQGPAMPPDLK